MRSIPAPASWAIRMRVAGVGLGAKTHVLAERFGLKLPPHVHAVVETARGQHHAAPRRDGDLTSAVFDDGAGDPVAVGCQPQQRGLGPDTGMPARRRRRTNPQQAPARRRHSAAQHAGRPRLGLGASRSGAAPCEAPAPSGSSSGSRRRWSASESTPPSRRAAVATGTAPSTDVLNGLHSQVRPAAAPPGCSGW